MKVKIIVAIFISVLVTVGAAFGASVLIKPPAPETVSSTVVDDIDLEIYTSEAERLQKEAEEKKKENVSELLPETPEGISISNGVFDAFKVEPVLPESTENIPAISLPETSVDTEVEAAPETVTPVTQPNLSDEQLKKVFVTFEDFLNY